MLPPQRLPPFVVPQAGHDHPRNLCMPYRKHGRCNPNCASSTAADMHSRCRPIVFTSDGADDAACPPPQPLWNGLCRAAASHLRTVSTFIGERPPHHIHTPNVYKRLTLSQKKFPPALADGHFRCTATRHPLQCELLIPLPLSTTDHLAVKGRPTPYHHLNQLRRR